MDLKKRLAQLDRLTRRPAEDLSPLAASRPADPAGALDELGLTRHEGAAGPVWYREQQDDLAPPPDPLPDLTGLFSQSAASAPAVAGLLLLDTETTGLAGGTGTLVFQLGLSWWQRGRLHTRQYFLPGPADEAAMLADLAALANRFTHVVTYNGASFDLPLLRTRALLNRTPDPLGHLAGWDLLVPARRLWRNRLPDCRQQTIESAICGRHRSAGDIDGARIPQTWFDFLQTGRPGLLPRVLTHNQRDMVGMADILGRVAAVGGWLASAQGSAEWPLAAVADDRAGAWGLARICERRREQPVAAACCRRAWAGAWGGVASGPLRRRFRRDMIRILKREREWELVEQVIHDGLDSDPQDAGLQREAAILYEHRLVDLPRAHHHAVAAGDGHRTARLERLLAR